MSNPIKKCVCAIGTNENNINVANGIEQQHCKIVFNLYAPVRFTGQQCIETMMKISDKLFTQNNGEQSRTCEIGAVTYNSTTRSYSAKLYLILESGTQSLNNGDTLVNICVEDKKVAEAESFSVKIKRNVFDVMIYNSSKPIDTVLLGTEYILNLKRVVKYKGEIDLYALNDFSVTVTSGSRKITYFNCDVSEIYEDTNNEKFSVQNCVIKAKDCKIEEV